MLEVFKKGEKRRQCRQEGRGGNAFVGGVVGAATDEAWAVSLKQRVSSACGEKQQHDLRRTKRSDAASYIWRRCYKNAVGEVECHKNTM
jgi:hypothetical protein